VKCLQSVHLLLKDAKCNQSDYLSKEKWTKTNVIRAAEQCLPAIRSSFSFCSYLVGCMVLLSCGWEYINISGQAVKYSNFRSSRKIFEIIVFVRSKTYFGRCSEANILLSEGYFEYLMDWCWIVILSYMYLKFIKWGTYDISKMGFIDMCVILTEFKYWGAPEMLCWLLVDQTYSWLYFI
jgi:hypothetical protein